MSLDLSASRPVVHRAARAGRPWAGLHTPQLNNRPADRRLGEAAGLTAPRQNPYTLSPMYVAVCVELAGDDSRRAADHCSRATGSSGCSRGSTSPTPSPTGARAPQARPRSRHRLVRPGPLLPVPYRRHAGDYGPRDQEMAAQEDRLLGPSPCRRFDLARRTADPGQKPGGTDRRNLEASLTPRS